MMDRGMLCHSLFATLDSKCMSNCGQEEINLFLHLATEEGPLGVKPLATFCYMIHDQKSFSCPIFGCGNGSLLYQHLSFL